MRIFCVCVGEEGDPWQGGGCKERVKVGEYNQRTLCSMKKE
jgi:hypothetical protein